MLTNLLLLVAVATSSQWDLSCQGTSPRLERLHDAVRLGQIDVIRADLDTGGDIDELWRDTWAPMVCQSQLYRSIYYGQEAIFHLLLERGADPLKLPNSVLQIPVRDGKTGIARALLARGLKPHDNADIVRAGVESKSVEMLRLLLSSGVKVTSFNVPQYALTDELVRFLVPAHISANDESGIGEPCDLELLFKVFSKGQDGCEGAIGPFWFNFVLTGRHELVEYMIQQGADLTMHTAFWAVRSATVHRVTALDIASRRKDKRMIDLLKRAVAAARR